MLIISYDIQKDKLRNQFSKYLKKHGFRLQYSVFQIQNSDHILKNIIAEITNRFEKQFSQNDSILIFQLSETCKITRFGYAKHEESDIIFIK